jgi:hypothetical protein
MSGKTQVRAKRIRNRQFDLTDMHLKDVTAPAVWVTVLSAR